MEHVLVIGGSGILRGVCRHFAGEGKAVSVIARSKERIIEMVAETQKSPGLIIPIAVDYTQADDLRDKLDEAAAHLGPPILTICRIAPDAAPTRKAVAEFLNDNAAGTQMIDVICEESPNVKPEWADELDVVYCQIIVGSSIEENEISAKILDAI